MFVHRVLLSDHVDEKQRWERLAARQHKCLMRELIAGSLLSSSAAVTAVLHTLDRANTHTHTHKLAGDLNKAGKERAADTVRGVF